MANLELQDVLGIIETEIAAKPSRQVTLPESKQVERVKAMQRRFREDPIGGRLTGLKKFVHWFSASAFDRQAKVVESLLDVVEDLESEVNRLRTRTVDRPAAAPRAMSAPAAGARPVAGGWGDHSPTQIGRALTAKAEMEIPERLLVYSLIFGLKPELVLEIGTFRGGSSDIICAAMDDNGFGRLFCVDPNPRVPDAVLARIQNRATIFKGPSPDILRDVRDQAGDDFTFALIDGDHSHAGVVRDIEGALEVVAPGGHLLFHDSHYFEVQSAIEEVLQKFPDRLEDAGDLSSLQNPQEGEGSVVDGKQVIWGGLRLLRVRG